MEFNIYRLQRPTFFKGNLVPYLAASTVLCATTGASSEDRLNGRRAFRP